MKEKENPGNESNAGTVIAGIAGLTAAAVGVYYLYGHKDAKKHQAQVKGRMLKAKGEILEELEKAKEISQESYDDAVERIATKYKEIKSLDPEDIATFVAEMKDHWHGIQKSFKKVSAKTAKKTTTAKSKTKAKKE